MNSVQLQLMGEAKFGSDCVAMRQNFSDADGIDLIKCRGKYNSWNGRKGNARLWKVGLISDGSAA